MTKSRATRVVALLLLVTLVTGFVAVSAAPDDGRVTGIWPVGLATAALLVARRRWVPHVLATIGAIAVVTIWAGGRPAEVALGYALGTVLEVLVAWWFLTDSDGDDDDLPPLKADRHLARFIGATALGALVAAALSGGTAFLADWGNPWVVALGIGTAHLASQLTLVPFFMRLPEHHSIARPAERVVQWLVIVPLTALLFWPHDFPQLVFLVIPLLGWSALRCAPREALLQMLVVLGVAIQLTTYDHGPFARVPVDYGFPVDARGILLATFTIACALVVVPLMLTVGQQLENARQVAAERDKVQNIVNAATGIAIIGTDAAGRVTLFNPGAQRLLGYEKDEALGRPSSMFHTEREMAAFAASLGVRDEFLEVAGALTGPQAAATDIRFLRKDGEERTHSMTLTRMTDDRGRAAGYVMTSEDITERVTAQQALVEALATETQAVERLREVDQVKDAFVSSVSHELRTPITSIVGYLEMLGEGEFGDLNAAQADAVRRVSSNSRRLLSLIDDLLTLSRVQDDGLVLAHRAFDLREVVRCGPRRGRARGGHARPRRQPGAAAGAGPVRRGQGDARAGRHEPGRQRGQVHARRWPRRSAADHRRGERPGGGLRHRHRDPRAGAGPVVHQVLPVLHRPEAGHPRQRAGPVDRRGDRAGTRRDDRGRLRAGPRDDVPGPHADGGLTRE